MRYKIYMIISLQSLSYFRLRFTWHYKSFKAFFDWSINKILSSDWSIKCFEAFVASSRTHHLLLCNRPMPFMPCSSRNHHTHTLCSPLFCVRHILRKRYSEEDIIICVHVTLISINIFHSPFRCIQLKHRETADIKHCGVPCHCRFGGQSFAQIKTRNRWSW